MSASGTSAKGSCGKEKSIVNNLDGKNLMCECVCHYSYVETHYFTFINKEELARHNLFDWDESSQKLIYCQYCLKNNCGRPLSTLKMSEFKNENKNFNDFSVDQMEFIRRKIKSPHKEYDSFLNEFCSGFIRYSKLKLSLDNELIECSQFLNSDNVTKLLREKNVYNIHSYVLKSASLLKFNKKNDININEYFTILVNDVIKKLWEWSC